MIRYYEKFIKYLQYVDPTKFHEDFVAPYDSLVAIGGKMSFGIDIMNQYRISTCQVTLSMMMQFTSVT